jgi:peptidyl-prolyl cis-trans isomerase B (cyclophilin B)
MTRPLRFCAAILLASFVGACSGPDRPAQRGASAPGRTHEDDLHALQSELTTSRGALVMALLSEDAPAAVREFVRLARGGHYDGARFRAGDGLLLVAPRGRPSHPPLFNRRRHLIGSVATAQEGERRWSGGFYVCLRPLREQDGRDAVFGRVVRGFDALAALRDGDVLERVRIVPEAAVQR